MSVATNRWVEGVNLFNRGSYWDCHEVLEPLWLSSSKLDRHFYQGIILLAAALHKARTLGGIRGGRRNYAKALAHLALVPDSYHGVNVRELEARCHMALREATYAPTIPLETL